MLLNNQNPNTQIKLDTLNSNEIESHQKFSVSLEPLKNEQNQNLFHSLENTEMDILKHNKIKSANEQLHETLKSVNIDESNEPPENSQNNDFTLNPDPSTLTFDPPMMSCDNGWERVSYTLVCDFRADCSDDSDEDFCTEETKLEPGYWDCGNKQVRNIW